MEVEMYIRIPLNHLAHKFNDLQWIQHAERVWQHETFYVVFRQDIKHSINILRRILHTVAPVFKIKIDIHVPGPGVIQSRNYVVNVF